MRGDFIRGETLRGPRGGTYFQPISYLGFLGPHEPFLHLLIIHLRKKTHSAWRKVLGGPWVCSRGYLFPTNFLRSLRNEGGKYRGADGVQGRSPAMGPFSILFQNRWTLPQDPMKTPQCERGHGHGIPVTQVYEYPILYQNSSHMR